MSALRAGADTHLASVHLRLDAVHDRVFDERLQQHRRDARLRERLRQLERVLQPAAHPYRLHVEIAAQEPEFLLERAALLARSGERCAQVAVQVREHDARALRVGLDQRIEVRERVEQEMRLDLRLQQLQLRLDRVALDLARSLARPEEPGSKQARSRGHGERGAPGDRGPPGLPEDR
jgi:hypothetical protein